MELEPNPQELFEKLKRENPWLAQTLARGADQKKAQEETRLRAERERLRLDEEGRREDERRRLEEMPPLYVVHTVHGTRFPLFAKATWPAADSEFSKALVEGLGWRVRIEPFRWSGKNSVNARAEAAWALQVHLQRCFKKYGDAQHVVIAHSHGGNVAFMAASSQEIAGRLLGVVTLATPFLDADMRSHDDEEQVLDSGTGVFAGLFAGWTVLLYGLGTGQKWGLWPWAVGVAVATWALLVLGAWVRGRMLRHGKSICTSMPSTALRIEQVAVIRVQGDEASALISGARLAGTLSALVWRTATERVFVWLNKILGAWDYGGMRSTMKSLRWAGFEKIDSPRPTDYAGAAKASIRPAIAAVVPVMAMQLLQSPDPAAQITTAILIGIYGLPAGFSVALVALGIPFAILSSASLAPCGLSVPLAGPYVRLTAESSPPGTWSVTHFQARRDGGGLFHSEAYERAEVREHIVRWTLERAAAVQRPAV